MKNVLFPLILTFLWVITLMSKGIIGDLAMIAGIIVSTVWVTVTIINIKSRR